MKHVTLLKPVQKIGRKTFQKDGHWIEKPEKTAILICVCGNKYIKTRDGQKSCVRCLR